MTARNSLYEALDPHAKGWCACMTCHEKRKQLLDAHRAEVLEEAAQMLEAEAERGQKMGVIRISMRADGRRVRELATAAKETTDADVHPHLAGRPAGRRVPAHAGHRQAPRTPEVAVSAADIPESLVEYLASRELARADSVFKFLEALTPRERALVREAAVMGWVQGLMRDRAEDGIPKDGVILGTVVEACLAAPDLYPATNYVANLEARDGA